MLFLTVNKCGLNELYTILLIWKNICFSAKNFKQEHCKIPEFFFSILWLKQTLILIDLIYQMKTLILMLNICWFKIFFKNLLIHCIVLETTGIIIALVEKSTLILFTLTFVHYFWVIWLSSALLCPVLVDQEWSWQKDNVFKIPIWLIIGRTSSGMFAKHILE